jgi:bla regulator protein blaR1
MVATFVHDYLPSFFDWVIETSIMASIVVGLILCVKLLLRNTLTPRWQYLLWMIVIVRMLLPWSPESSYSIYSIISLHDKAIFDEQLVTVSSSTEQTQEKVTINETHPINQEPIHISSSIQLVEDTKEEKHHENTSFYTIISSIWLIGVLTLSYITIIANRRLSRYINNQPIITNERIVTIFENCKKSMSIQQDIPLLFAGEIASPTVFGFVRPKILLSGVHMEVLDEQQLRYIFYHELSHIKRRDIGVNWLMHALLILNWFNPLLWYAYSRMREDQEMACDALALTYIDSKEQLAYGHTIIRLLEHYSSYYQVPSLANLSRSKKTLKRRIIMIKHFQKKSYRWSALGVIVVVAVALTSLLNAHGNSETELAAQAAVENLIGNEEQALVDFGVSKEEYKQILEKKQNEQQVELTTQAAVEKIIGNEEQAFANFGVSEEEYKQILEEKTVAQKFLTKDEFNRLVQLQIEATTIMKNTARDGQHMYNSDLLNTEGQAKLKENFELQKPLWKKIQDHIEKSTNFPLQVPYDIAEGYQLKEAKVEAEITPTKLEPIHRSEYKKDELGFTIYQSTVLKNINDPFSRWINKNEQIDTYDLEGLKLSFSHSTDNDVRAMKIIVPADKMNSAYQIVIISSNLNKEELEGIILSLLK